MLSYLSNFVFLSREGNKRSVQSFFRHGFAWETKSTQLAGHITCQGLTHCWQAMWIATKVAQEANSRRPCSWPCVKSERKSAACPFVKTNDELCPSTQDFIHPFHITLS